MTVYTWPTPTAGNKAFWPRAVRWRVLYNDRSTTSALSGYTQTGSNPGPRLACSLDIDRQTYAERQQLAAFIDRLEGRKHRVALHDLANPLPRGVIVPSGVTLGATAAQFATSLVLAGCRGANALLGGSFETDANADGVADAWARYSLGTTGALSAALDTSAVTHGTKRQLLAAAALGGTTGDRHGVFQDAVPVAHLAGLTCALACTVDATAGTKVTIGVAWYDAGASFIVGTDWAATVTAGASAQAVLATGLCPSNAVTARILVYQHSGSAAAAVLYVDAVRLVAGSTSASYPGPAQLLAGDWAGLSSGQLVRVVADATASELGAMTVEVRQPLRAAASSGSALTLTRPTTQMVLAINNGEAPAVPFDANGMAPAMTLDFVEAWA